MLTPCICVVPVRVRHHRALDRSAPPGDRPRRLLDGVDTDAVGRTLVLGTAEKLADERTLGVGDLDLAKQGQGRLPEKLDERTLIFPDPGAVVELRAAGVVA